MPIIKRAISFFRNIHFQSLLGNGVMAVFGMITIAILYRALSIKDLGVYIFLMTILNLIDTLRGGFLTTSFIKFYSGTHIERAQEVSGSAWLLSLYILGATIFVNIPLYFLSFHLNNEGLVLFLKYFSIISLVTLPSFMANLVVQGNKRFDRLLWSRLISQLLFICMILVLIIFNISTLKNIIYAFILSNLICSLVVILLGWTAIGTIIKSSRKTLLELFHFGKYSVGTSLSTNLFAVTDTFFINFYLGPSALAVYNLGGKLLQIIEIPLLSFAASNMPSLSAHYNNDNKQMMMDVMQKMVGMLTVAIFFVMILSIIFAEPVIALIGGEKYLHTEAPNLFRIFMSIAIIYPTDRFFALTLDVIHKPQVNLYKILIMLLLNLIGDYIGVTVFKSIYSVAIVNILPFVTAIIIAYFPLYKYYKFNFWNIYIMGYKELMLLIKTTVSSPSLNNKR